MIGPLAITTPAAWVPTLRLVPSSFRAMSTHCFTAGSESYSRRKSGTSIASFSPSAIAPFIGTSLHM